MKTAQRKLDYVSEFMTYANKKEDKLKAKRVKLMSDQAKFDSWENAQLTNNFNPDQIRKLI